MKERSLADNAVIWAYHTYSDSQAVAAFDTFMNLSAMYGMYRVARFSLSSAWSMLGRLWRSITTSRSAMFDRYSRLVQVTRIDSMRKEFLRVPYQTWAVVTQYGKYSEYAASLCQNLGSQGFNIILISDNAENGHQLIESLKQEIHELTEDGESWTGKDKYQEFAGIDPPKFQGMHILIDFESKSF
jgi:hypothetical protein